VVIMPDPILQEMENFCKNLGGRIEHKLLGAEIENGFVCRLDEEMDAFIRVISDKRREIELCFKNECVNFYDMDETIEVDSLPFGETNSEFVASEFGSDFRLWRETDKFIVRKTYNGYKFSL